MAIQERLGGSGSSDIMTLFRTVGYLFGVFVVVAGYFYLLLETGIRTPITEGLYAIHEMAWWEGYLAGLLVVSAGVALYTGSVARAMGLCFACGAGVGVVLGGLGATGFKPPSLFFRLGWTLLLGGATAVIVGGVSSIPVVLLSRIKKK